MSATSKLYFETIGVEEEFYVLKFPLKLWRIVNECRSGAIRWGPFGKTILIDYNQFQAEYLECPVPKFKTRNMTSFVRQLNMYGFKKLQTQQRNVMSRFCNIHEFYNESFRGNRPDLLSKVKRRTIPLKMERLSHSMRPSKKLPPSEMCKVRILVDLDSYHASFLLQTVTRVFSRASEIYHWSTFWSS